MRGQSGLDELQNEFVLRLRRVWRVLISRIIRITQEISLLQQPESRRFDLLPKKSLLDTMQGAGLGDAGTGPARMIGDNVEAFGLKRAEDGLVHCRPIYAEMSEVVIVEHQGREINALCREFGRNGIGERSRDGDD